MMPTFATLCAAETDPVTLECASLEILCFIQFTHPKKRCMCARDLGVRSDYLDYREKLKNRVTRGVFE